MRTVILIFHILQLYYLKDNSYKNSDIHYDGGTSETALRENMNKRGNKNHTKNNNINSSSSSSRQGRVNYHDNQLQ